jgi:DNA-binding transcriptional MerR regulator
MVLKAREPSKEYFRIGEVSEVVGVEPHVLRYWESEFPTIRPKKSSTGQRVYSRQDVDRLLRVKELLRNQGFSIAGARKRLREAPGPEEQLAMASANVAEPKDPSRKRSIRKQLMGLRREILSMLDELSGEEAGPDRG